MFSIKSYIKAPHKVINDLKKATSQPEAYFVDIDNEQKIIKIKNQLGLNYLEGAIYITFNNQIIMSYEMWDLVDTLWSYVLILIQDLIDKNKSDIYFPDQAIQIKMQANKDIVIFSLVMPNNETRQWLLPKDLFLKALLDGAQHFFAKMFLIFEENQEDYSDELKKIKNLKKKLETKNIH